MSLYMIMYIINYEMNEPFISCCLFFCEIPGHSTGVYGDGVFYIPTVGASTGRPRSTNMFASINVFLVRIQASPPVYTDKDVQRTHPFNPTQMPPPFNPRGGRVSF